MIQEGLLLMRVGVRGALAGVASLLVVSTCFLSANTASADSIQYQSYQRASQTEACTAQPGETPWQSSWGADSSWHPSWEQWANGGTGGWTCTRSITWAKDSSPSCESGGPCVLGDIGPGGGLVFLISGGKTYEMAPKNWSGTDNDLPTLEWCDVSNITGADQPFVGDGSANTNMMQPIACDWGAGVSARAYAGGGLTDWFLPSKNELNAMCNYSRNPTAPAEPTESCYGSGGTTQDAPFAAGAYGFASALYWSSTEAGSYAWYENLNIGDQDIASKSFSLSIRPIRAF